jgi:hypothetical protein
VEAWREFVFRLFGASCALTGFTHGLRRGLHSFAASQLRAWMRSYKNIKGRC